MLGVALKFTTEDHPLVSWKDPGIAAWLLFLLPLSWFVPERLWDRSSHAIASFWARLTPRRTALRIERIRSGRKKFLINRGGYKVNPLEVEHAIQSHPKIKEVVVLGTPSRFGDEAVRCVAVTHEPCTEDEIVEHCRERIADFKIPSRIEFRDELPKSQTGKILRHEL